jgi:myosin heavy subunit
MMETIRIRRMGYPVRYTHQEFRDRYRVLNSRKFVHAHKPSASVITPASNATTRQVCEAVMANMGHIPTIIADDWLLGLTKVFIRDTQYRALEELRNKVMTEHVRRIQSVWRMYRLAKLYKRMRKAAICLQTSMFSFTQRLVVINVVFKPSSKIWPERSIWCRSIQYA